MTDPQKTVKQVLESGASYLEGKGIEDGRSACELLLSRLLRCGRLDLYLQFDRTLPENYLEAMRRGVARVAKNEPVQYVIGQTDFMGHAIKVDPRALIPRPETEILVETVLGCEDLWHGAGSDTDSRPVIADVGTGTGCIAIALALEKPAGVYIGLDTSEDALSLARENAGSHGLEDKIAFVQGELSDCVEPETVSAVVSNPPYVPTGEYEQLDSRVREHEPRAALDGGPGGLGVIEALAQDAACALTQAGFLFLEISADQAAAVRSLLQAAGFGDVTVRQDLAGRDRVVQARLALS